MKKVRWLLLVVLTICMLIVLSGCSDKDKERYIELVKNGYLGEYTDATVDELLENHYSSLYDNIAWEEVPTETGDKLVQVIFSDAKGSIKPATIQFTMLGEECFKLSKLDDPAQTVKKSTDLLTALNSMYYHYYTGIYPEAAKSSDRGMAFIKRLEGIPGSAVKYGASADYAGNRAEICQLDGELPLEESAAELLEEAGTADRETYYPSPTPTPTPAPTPTPTPIPTPEPTPEPISADFTWADNFFIGAWDNNGTELIISAGPAPGQYYVEITSMGAAGKNVYTYDAEFDNELYILFCYNGTLRQESKFGIYDIYSEVGTAEITEIFHEPGNEQIEYHCTYAPDSSVEEREAFCKVG